MVGSNLTDVQLQQIVDKSIIEADKDKDGKLSFEEFSSVGLTSCPSVPRKPPTNRLNVLMTLFLILRYRLFDAISHLCILYLLPFFTFSACLGDRPRPATDYPFLDSMLSEFLLFVFS